MTRHSRSTPLTLGAAALASVLASATPGCRRVQVEDEPRGTPAPVQADAGSTGGGLIGDIDQANPSASTGPALDGGNGNGGGNRTDAGGSGAPASDAGASLDSAAPISGLITEVTVLASSLTAINPPAVGSGGVSLLHYPSTTQATTLFVDWNGAATQWYGALGAYYLYTAASGDRQIALVYGRSYGIYASGAANELSGTPTTYKEFLAANESGFAWVDYQTTMMGDHGPGRPQPPGTALSGKIVFQTWSGTRAALTDSLRYRARLDLSRTHVAFIEYATSASVGQIVVHPLAGGAPIIAAPSDRHQDRPAIDGDWVVWEEYPTASDSVIRARNLSTGQVRELSATTGFRTNADILGTRVVWEDQRAGSGDIYVTDLAGNGGERVAVSGKGHSSSSRLTSDGLVWIESNAGVIGLARARWNP